MPIRSHPCRYSLIIGMWLFCIGSSQAALFNFTYDDLGDHVIGTDNIVGTGIFSFSGPATVGSFALSSLADLTFNATIGSQIFVTSDINTALSASGISIFDLGAGEFGMVFTGQGGASAFGSLDLERDQALLTHEPTAGIAFPGGCCGGNGITNLYALILNRQEQVYFGDYSATTASNVPAPGSFALVGLALIGLGWSRHRMVSLQNT